MPTSLKATTDSKYQPNAMANRPAPARSSFFRSSATLKPLKIFVHAAGRGPTCSSAMHLLLRTDGPADSPGRAGFVHREGALYGGSGQGSGGGARSPMQRSSLAVSRETASELPT